MKKKNFVIMFTIILIVLAAIVFTVQPISYTGYKECVMSLCDCECYLRGETPEEKEGRLCGEDCTLYNAHGCKYVGVKCPYNITGCAILNMANDFFIQEQCAVLKID